MANEKNQRRRVFRQSWKPGKLLTFLHGLWVAFYSVAKIAVGALVTVLAIAAICMVVFVSTLADYLEKDILPNASTILDNISLNKISYVYFLDANGDIQTLQELHSDSKQEWVAYDDIPKNLVHAAVAIEDKRFFEHQGVDWITTIKACAGMFMGSSSAGGSSITQQMIKNVLLTEDERADDVTVQRKLMEILRAIELEKDYDKEVIMEYYLNVIFLGNQCTGVKTAAATYFGKELEHLTVAECAALVSITNNPSKFNPYRTQLDSYGKTGMEQLYSRRDTTLHQMFVQGYITEEEYNEAIAEEIVLKKGIDPGDKVADCLQEGCGYHGKVSTFTKDDNGVYYCPQCGNVTEIAQDASEYVYSWFVDTVIEDVAQAMAERDGVTWNTDTKKMYKTLISQGGYHIYSTLDMKVQEQVDQIYEDLTQIPTAQSLQQLQSAIVVIDNATGDIIAMSGGVGEKEVHDAFNRATEADLQPGSSIKPLSIYAPAFELGYYTPASVVADLPLYYQTNEKPFPRNDDFDYRLSHSIMQAMTDSVNAVAVNLLESIGLSYSYNFAKDSFGLSKLTDNYVNSQGKHFSDVGYAPLALGAPTVGVSVREMTEAYATFSNGGVRREARTYTKVYNSEGQLVLDNSQESKRIISEKTANYISYCLDNAVNSGTGTAADLKKIGIDVAGKTGSTSSFKDRWFCGYTNYYTAAVWCGYDTPEVITLTGTKTNPACRLWKKVMEPLHQGLTSQSLYDETGMYEVEVCLDCGKLATQVCTMDVRDSNRIAKVKVYDEDLPSLECDCHVFVDWCEDCDAAANEYCKRLATVGKAKVTRRALVKTTENKANDVAAAIGKGLTKPYRTDKYIYLVDSSGAPISFYGFDGDKNEGLNLPYLQATGHTAEDWQKYMNSQVIQPIVPSDPTQQDDPAQTTNEEEP